MEQYFIDTILDFRQGTLEITDDLFEIILKEREKEIDPKRFFLEFIPKDKLGSYNFSDTASLKTFRDDRLCYRNPLMRMGGCNLHPDYLEKDRKSGYLRYAGIKMSDPYGKIFGSFDIRDHVVTYSPLFPRFYDERDLIKFAREQYFTTMTFEDIMKVQIEKADQCFVHVGNSYEIRRKSPYILEEVTKDQMMEFVYDSEKGEKIYEKRIL